MSSPSPPMLNVVADNTNEHAHSSSSIENLSPSIIIIILILAITLLVSVSLCLLLRHLNRRCLLHLSSSTATATATAESHRHSSRRVSPENLTFSLIDSLPLFTFSSVTRRSTSTNSSDCAVCLSKFEPHDQLRLLPLCCHAFHAHCVDTWLQSNQTCPLCRSSVHASESDLIKALLSSTTDANGDSFRLEIGSISRRQAPSNSGEQRRSYSIGSFDYIVEEESEIIMTQTHRTSVSDKEEIGAESAQPQPDPSLAAEVAAGRSWLKDYVDRLSSSFSSRAVSFRSSGRFFTGSSRRSDIAGAGDWDVEANRMGEEISELFRWFSGV